MSGDIRTRGKDRTEERQPETPQAPAPRSGPLHLAQVSIDLPAALRFYRRIWGPQSDGLADERFLIKMLMTEIFPGVSPRPWRVQSFDGSGETMVLGYTIADQDRLRELAEMAMPELVRAVPAESIYARPMRRFRPGERLQAHLTFCPTVRPNLEDGSRPEIDAWVWEARHAAAEKRDPRLREAVYSALAVRRLERAAAVRRVAVTAWRLARLARKNREGEIGALPDLLPLADVVAEIEVSDPVALDALVSGGIGRAKAYGCGMLLLRPAA